jgi:regulator of replication initiation timing
MQQTKQWYTKKEILELYPISNSTYKTRLRNIDTSKTKFVPSVVGSPKRLIHVSELDNLFRQRRRLSKRDYKQIIKWVRNHNWNYIGNIVPVSSSIDDLKHKIRFLFEELKKLQIENNQLTLFYTIEKNPNDNYYHSHFLINCEKDMIDQSEIINKLEIICEPNTKQFSRIHLETYDNKYGKGGAFYSSKQTIYFHELLG